MRVPTAPSYATAVTLAEFDNPEALVEALVELRRLGLVQLDAYTPYPVREAEEALELRRSPIPIVMFVAGCVGVAFAYLLQYAVIAVDYPIIVGGMPADSGPAFIPITFETMVLIAGLTGLVAFLVICRLPRLWHPLFEVEAFSSATIDGFWVAIGEADPAFERGALEAVLRKSGARSITSAGGEQR